MRAVLATGLALALASTGCVAVSGDARPHPDATRAPKGPGDGSGSSAPRRADDAEPPSGGSPSAPAGKRPLSGSTIAIDPGHNGGNADSPERIGRTVPAGPEKKACNTVGAETDDGYTEHELTWALGTTVREQLESAGARVVLSRDDDAGVGPCVNERAEVANDAKADAALSIHADGGPVDGRGFHVITPGSIAGYTEDAGIVAPSRRLATDVRTAFREGTSQPYADYIGEDGLDERTDLGGLNLSEVPAVYVETGNMRNATDAKRFKDGEWRTKAGRALAAGLARYVSRE